MSDDNKEGAGVPVAEVDENPRFTTAYPLLNDLLQETWWMAKGPNNMDTGMAWYESLKSFLESIATPPAVMPAAPSDAADARRYRWLIGRFGVTRLPCMLEPITGDYVADGKEAIDAAIDSELSQTMQPQAEPAAGEQAEAVRLANAIDPFTRTSIDNLTLAVTAKFLRSLAPGAAIAAREQPVPTPQQISDYLNGLDAIRREVVMREAIAAREQEGKS